uniref:Uncharacterized protein n=1 Tax=Rhizophora mucronata TaxID=61149 RepID=A0A2P2KUG5_RHIMU
MLIFVLLQSGRLLLWPERQSHVVA